MGTAGESLEAATEAAETRHHALEAQKRGLTVTELDTLSNAGRIPIKTACEAFLKLKAGKAKKTLAAYSLHLADFQEAIGSRVRFMDAINADTMRRYRDWMAQKGSVTEDAAHSAADGHLPAEEERIQESACRGMSSQYLKLKLLCLSLRMN
jgi:hypothetical protein